MKCPLEDYHGPEVILAYVSQNLETETVSLFEKHMAECQSCREFAHGHQSMWKALDVFEAAPISDDFNRRLYQRIEEPIGLWQRLTQSFRGPLLVRQGLQLVAAASLLLVAGVVWQQRPSTKPAQLQPALSAQIEALQPEQVESALDDMEMVREFSHPVTAESSDSKM